MESKLEQELKKWEEREQRFRDDKVFSPEVLDGPLLKEKLAHFDRLSILYKPIAGSDQLDYRLLQAERQKIRVKLHPNFFRRLFSSLISKVKLNRQANMLNGQYTFSNDQLKSTLIRAGFAAHVERVFDNMKLGREFTLPVSYYVNEAQRMDYQLNFNRDVNGEFKFESYKASLKQDSGIGQIEQTFSVGTKSGFSADQAFHLLSGRSVHNKVSGGAWHQLDFNDKDAEGNYRFKTFPDHYHNVNYNKLLSELPIAPGFSINQNLLMDKMANGDQVIVPLLKEGFAIDYLIQINPQKRELGIYQTDGSKTDLNNKWKSIAEGQNANSNKEGQNRRRAKK